MKKNLISFLPIFLILLLIIQVIIKHNIKETGILLNKDDLDFYINFAINKNIISEKKELNFSLYKIDTNKEYIKLSFGYNHFSNNCDQNKSIQINLVKKDEIIIDYNSYYKYDDKNLLDIYVNLKDSKELHINYFNTYLEYLNFEYLSELDFQKIDHLINTINYKDLLNTKCTEINKKKFYNNWDQKNFEFYITEYYKKNILFNKIKENYFVKLIKNSYLAINNFMKRIFNHDINSNNLKVIDIIKILITSIILFYCFIDFSLKKIIFFLISFNLINSFMPLLIFLFLSKFKTNKIIEYNLLIISFLSFIFVYENILFLIIFLILLYMRIYRYKFLDIFIILFLILSLYFENNFDNIFYFCLIALFFLLSKYEFKNFFLPILFVVVISSFTENLIIMNILSVILFTIIINYIDKQIKSFNILKFKI